MTHEEWCAKMYREVWKPAYDEWIKLYPFSLEDLPGEIWKPIPDYEKYHGSTFGRVKSFWGKTPRILKPALKEDGYLIVNLSEGGKSKTFKVARLVAITFLPNPENKPEVNHLHGRFNHYVGSLEWATKVENMQHACETGLKRSGEGHYAAKLTNAQVKYIRENPDNLTMLQFGKMFGVSESAISLIQRGKTYKNVGGVIRQVQKQPANRLPAGKRNKIRKLAATGQYSQHQLARMFDCSRSSVANIIKEE